METPKKPVKKTSAKSTGAKKPAAQATKPKKRIEEDDEDDDYIIPIEDIDYDSLQDFDDVD